MKTAALPQHSAESLRLSVPTILMNERLRLDSEA
jgi:hypothetical protein